MDGVLEDVVGVVVDGSRMERSEESTVVGVESRPERAGPWAA